jgi:hypothetical protein
MGILRSFLKAVGGISFIIFLSVLIFMLAISNFTSCNTLKPIFTDLIKQQLNETPEQLNSTYSILSSHCQTSGNETIYVESFKLNCSEIFSTTPEKLPEVIGNQTFDEIYFRRYNCSFFNCIQLPGQEKFFYLMGRDANIFFNESIIYLALATVISAFILIAASETWSGRFKAIGISLVFIGVSYFIIPVAKGLTNAKVPESAAPIIDKIFNSISTNLLIAFILGIILTAVGFVLSHLSKKVKK